MKTVQVKLPIARIAVSTNKNGKISIVTAASKYNESGVFQLTENHLDNLAEQAMNCDAGTLADAIAYGNQMYETSSLIVTFRFCKAGEPIGTDKDGNAIVSADGSEVFTKDHWRTESFDGVELAEEATEFIRELLRDLAKDRLAAKRAGGSKRKQQQRTPKVESGADKGGNPELEAEQSEIEEELGAVFGDDDKPE